MKLCDSSVLVDIDRGGVGRRVERLDDEGRHVISTVTVTELRLEVNKKYESESSRSDAMDDLDRLLARFDVVDVSRPVATAAADIISALERQGNPLHDLHDVYIAATARTEQLPVLTANVDRFDRIDDVDVVDWHEY
ncbi:type II toxin-antitoxin system VapC family toxin [Natronorubrum tibetense]|uniref:Ribonuclease VapC n=1 Tax=Natronorubrum tibetense GA33 TaxID=1114856 RepID=L9VJT7_9EURY|nr:type II toxin-antitoxin system VapC family toxin [Natronorubrum tibetense]ELY37460.1 PilT protein domain-containing protein [Natronorubrum tibetense GA33]